MALQPSGILNLAVVKVVPSHNLILCHICGRNDRQIRDSLSDILKCLLSPIIHFKKQPFLLRTFHTNGVINYCKFILQCMEDLFEKKKVKSHTINKKKYSWVSNRVGQQLIQQAVGIPHLQVLTERLNEKSACNEQLKQLHSQHCLQAPLICGHTKHHMLHVAV